MVTAIRCSLPGLGATVQLSLAIPWEGSATLHSTSASRLVAAPGPPGGRVGIGEDTRGGVGEGGTGVGGGRVGTAAVGVSVGEGCEVDGGKAVVGVEVGEGTGVAGTGKAVVVGVGVGTPTILTVARVTPGSLALSKLIRMAAVKTTAHAQTSKVPMPKIAMALQVDFGMPVTALWELPSR
jgi:hypothetical protein